MTSATHRQAARFEAQMSRLDVYRALVNGVERRGNKEQTAAKAAL